MLKQLSIIITVLLLAIGCDNSNSTSSNNESPTLFRVTIENIADEPSYASSGVFNTPSGAVDPAPIFPGEAYEFDFSAVPGSRLSFATMFVQSNDLFYAPMESGIELYDNSGNQVSGDVTSQIYLWDAGSETNQEPGLGSDQAPRQTGADSGMADSNSNVRMAVDEFGNLPAVADVINVIISSTSATGFHVRIENVSDGNTLQTSDGASHAVPLAPGVWVIHNMDSPLFSAGMPDNMLGLEAIAEDGDPSGLGSVIAELSGVTQIIAPGVWAVHSDENPLFMEGMQDAGEGLEALAEDGSPGMLNTALMNKNTVLSHDVYDTPDNASSPGPVLPGNAYSFEFEAVYGYLSFATMLVQSNDLFLSPGMMGIELFQNGVAVSGDVTDMIYLWDAGTEQNEEPGIGLNQAPRQSGPDTGMDEMDNVQMVDDGYSYPEVSTIIRVTITGM